MCKTLFKTFINLLNMGFFKKTTMFKSMFKKCGKLSDFSTKTTFSKKVIHIYVDKPQGFAHSFPHFCGKLKFLNYPILQGKTWFLCV